MLLRLSPALSSLLALAVASMPASPQTAWTEVEEVITGYTGCCDDEMDLSGDTVVLGRGSARIHILERDPLGNWGETASFAPSTVTQATPRVAIDGDRILAGYPGGGAGSSLVGAVLVYERGPGGIWSETAKIETSSASGNLFGSVLDVSGDTLAIAANAPGSAGMDILLYEQVPPGSGTWSVVASLAYPAGIPVSGPLFGPSLDLDEDTLAVSAPGVTNFQGLVTGAVFLYERSTGWNLSKTLVPQDLELGFGPIALDGDRLAVGKEGQYIAELEGLSQDSTTGDLLALNRVERLLYRIDAQGQATPVASMLKNNINALATDSSTNTVYAVADGGGLVALPLDTAIPVDLGPTGFFNLGGLACDSASGVLYGALNEGLPSLVRIDLATGAGTTIGVTGLSAINGLAYDSQGGGLYGVTGSNNLVTLDTNTGVGSVVGQVGAPLIVGLDFDAATGLLVGSVQGTDELVSIDPQTAQAGTPQLVLGSPYFLSTPSASVRGAVYIYERDLGGAEAWGLAATVLPQTSPGFLGDRISLEGDVFASVDLGYRHVDLYERDISGNWGQSAEFYTINEKLSLLPVSLSGGRLAVGDRDEAPERGILRVYSPASMNYCTAGVSASGCQATLSASGIASASASSGFVVSAANVEGQKSGHFYLGVNGRQANSWGNGSSFQCVVPPVKRAPTLPVVGVQGQCDGAFAQDMNALWCSGCPKPKYNPGPGNFTQIQLWYRDPQNTSNQTTSFSDAIEVFLVP